MGYLLTSTALFITTIFPFLCDQLYQFICNVYCKKITKSNEPGF